MKKRIKRCVVSILMLNLSIVALAQAVSDKTVVIEKQILSESTIILKSVTNNSGYDLEIITRHGAEQGESFVVQRGITCKCDIECTHILANPFGEGAVNGGGGTIWNKKKTADAWKEQQIQERTANLKTSEKIDRKQSDTISKSDQSAPKHTIARKTKFIKGEAVVASFKEALEKDSYWSISSIENDERNINRHIESIKNWTDKELYVTDKDLIGYIQSEGKKIEELKGNIDGIVNTFLANYRGYVINGDLDYEGTIKLILKDRASRREMAIEDLQSAIDSIKSTTYFDIIQLDKQTLINIGVVIFILVVLIIWFSLFAKKKKDSRYQINVSHDTSNDASSAIVVRRKTTSILKKQSLEDVIDNKAYLKIECTDFCRDSAVRRMYIKNTCIKSIYNMYADDLRNPENPKEDGCMVLGRWVHDDHANEYYVSLEEIVRPGDDAVFQEYELNFGGKIKLRVAEKLRKLRRDTNLQYDLTCWVHSHPGLGVFFSNSDASVQLQLKHPTHPNFLTAIVVDILTPQQEFGIFTFKHDSSINSRNDLKKTYSLENLYKWAVESDRNSYKPEDHYNVLSKAESVFDECQGIQLSNGAIIDLSSIVTELKTGLVGWIHGFKTSAKNEYVINSISNEDSIADNELLGCLIIGTHCSIPSIRKAIWGYADKIKFVMFYSIKNETVTIIPVIDMHIIMEEKYYSEEKLEDLKIWTRRKR